MSQTADQNSITARALVPRLINIIVGLSIALVISLGGIAVLTAFVWQKKTEVVAISESGRVVPLISLDKPYVNDSRVAGFAEECLRTSFAHDFENFRMTMTSAKNCYTADGAINFESAMEPMLADVKTKHIVLSSAMEPTAVTKMYKLNGVVHWETQTPMRLYRRGTREQLTPLDFLVTTVIQRVALDENVRGISVRSINLKPVTAS